MKYRIGEWDVLESGTLVGNLNEPIEFLIDPDSNFILRMLFRTEPETERATARAEHFGDNGLQVSFINFDNPIAIGNRSPILIGNSNGREMRFNYRIASLEEGGKLVHFTFLLKKEVENGK